MPPIVMERAILSTREWIDGRIAKGEVQITEDPFVFKRNVGAYISVESVKPYHLTWYDLQATMDGLYQALWERGRFNQVQFGMHEAIAFSQIGTGRLDIEG